MKEGEFTVTVWKKLGYMQKGVSHVQNDTNCQDSVLLFENEDCIVASLADGLGSLKYSEVAAQTATETVCKCFAELNNPLEKFDTKEDLAQHILNVVVLDIQNKAIEMNISLNEMDCTLMFVCVLKKINSAIIGRLGDSAVCVIAEPKSIAINDGNKSANGTNAILDNDAIDHFDIQILDLDENNIHGFILSSDGLENELYMKGSDHVNKTAELYFNAWFTSDDPVAVIKERISKLTEIEGTPFDDDISIVILSRSDKKIILPEDPMWLCTCGFRNHLQTTYCQKCHKDFSVLYQNIRFRDYGGKAAFFEKINKNPEEEKRIIGMKSKSTAVKDGAYSPNDDLLNEPGTKVTSVVERIPESVNPRIITKLAPQSEKYSTLEVQNLSGIEVKELRTPGKETTTDPCEKSKSRVMPVSGTKTPFTEPVLKKELGDIKGQGIISPKQTTTKKSVLDSTDEVSGKKKQKCSSNSVEDTGISKGQADSKKNIAKSKKTRYNTEALKMIGILMSITLVIGLAIGGIFVKNITSSKVSKLSARVEELTKKVTQYEAELAEKEMEPEVLLPEDFSVLEDGSYYWGTLDDSNLPHRFGILRKDDIYYIGNFDHGKKNGEFSIVDSNGTYRVDNFLEDKLIPEDEDDDKALVGSEEENTDNSFSTALQSQWYETQYVANMRENPGKDNELVIALKVGTAVYLVDTTEKKADDMYWVHVRTEDGYEGWILSEAINRN